MEKVIDTIGVRDDDYSWVEVELAELPYADEYPELECDEVTEEAVQWD